MGTFLDKFPTTIYDINKSSISNYETVTNILYRIHIIKETLEKTSAYYVYTIRDGDKPETLAEKVYRNPEAHWIILYANDMVDPQYDWPLDYKNFNNYIENKYGSIANAQIGIHHYEKVTQRVEKSSGTITEIVNVIDYAPKTDSIVTLSSVTGTYTPGEAVYQGTSLVDSTFSANVISYYSGNGYLRMANANGQILRFNSIIGDSSSANGTVQEFVYPTVPYDYYLSIPETQDASLETLNVNNKFIEQTVYRKAVSYYDYESQQNDRKREIKIIKQEYYPQILSEFNRLVGENESPFFRKLS